MACTLIITEGDSAKALAMAGLSQSKLGMTNFGVFPLRGKVLNVRTSTVKHIVEHEVCIRFIIFCINTGAFSVNDYFGVVSFKKI